jgi:2,4-dienoyl-CoA reductase-like NADH-dependent reductase (Old Yellow Enzyme family)
MASITQNGIEHDRSGGAPPDLDVLWAPIDVGSITLPNRIVVTAHETNQGTSHTQNDGMGDRYIRYVAERARGGAGLVMPGGAIVHPHGAKYGHLPLWTDGVPEQYRALADAVHRHGDAKVFVQLFHPGPQSLGTQFLEEEHVLLASSAVPSASYNRVPKAMDRQDIATLTQAYGAAAARMRDAGIDGIELSAGHGYLLHSFFSPLVNRRTDEYGGDVANRCRLIIELLTEIRRQAGRDYPVSVRLSYEDFIGGAGLVPDIGEAVLREIHAAGLVDMFSISGGTYPTSDRMIPPAIAGLGADFVRNSRRAKAAIDDEVPVLVAAGIRTVQMAAEIIGGGGADLVSMMRAHLADPDVVSKARSGRLGEIRRCTGFNQSCTRRVGTSTHLTCTVNPVAGREGQWGGSEAPPPAATQLRVLVVGGGPAGLKAAETAAQRGHDVTLVDREAELGGQLRHAGRLPGRSTWLDTVEDLSASLQRLGVTIRLGEELTAEAVAAQGADRVVVATGSRFLTSGFSSAVPFRDAIPGADAPHVLDPITALEHPERLGSRVVILDDTGETPPLSLAQLLHEGGHEVEVVTAKLHAGSGTLMTLEFGWIYPQLKQAGVTITEQVLVTEIRPGELDVASIWGVGEPRTVAADSVVLWMERRSDDTLYEALEAAGVAADRIGDCVAPRDVDDAIYEGYQYGRAL